MLGLTNCKAQIGGKNLNSKIDYLGVNKDLLVEGMSVSTLAQEAIELGYADLTAQGALLIDTGKYTGRSPNDRFIVIDEKTTDTVAWGKSNLGIEKEVYENLLAKVKKHIEDKKLYLVKSKVGASEKHSMDINVFHEDPAQAVFSSQIFIKDNEREGYDSDFTVMVVPSLTANGKEDGVNSEAFIVLNFTEKVVLIGGSKYAGEIKKSVFTVMNYLLPEENVLPMHCSSNMGEDGDTALFFGLSGTGKTTLSSDPKRYLIGDDEHGWDEDGVFNFEGGCYAKCIDLDPEKEKEIYEAIKFGAVLENVIVDEDGKPDYTDDTLTPNTRVVYPLEHIEKRVEDKNGNHPNTVVFLTADAFGVVPPISKLSKDAAMYHFMSGYTSKLAGTERGIVSPESTFSALFGEPFMTRPIEEYAELLGEKIEKHDTQVYLVNTGWTGGGYGVGERMPLKYTRLMIDAALNGTLKDAEYTKDEIFNIEVPLAVDGVPSEILVPRNVWDDKEEFDKVAKHLAEEFKKNFNRFPDAPENILKAGPF